MHLAGRTAGARIVAGKLRAAGPDPRASRSHPLSEIADPRTDPRGHRLHKVLEDAGIKLATAATDILGASGRTMLNALVQGTTNADVLADLARGRLRAKLPALRQALVGRFRPHHAFLVTQVLAHLDYLDEAIAGLSEQVGTLLAASEDTLARLDTIPGVNRRTAEVLIAELGMDMTIFPTAAHCVSWAGLCPGNNESAGKHKSGKTRHGDPWLRAALVEAALGALHTRGCALAARYRRIMRHRGHKKAVVAVAHAILVIAYHVLKHQTTYRELGADYYDKRRAQHLARCRGDSRASGLPSHARTRGLRSVRS